MKLIIAIIQDDNISKVSKVLMENKISSTKLSSTGGFLKSGNTTLVMGIEDEQIDKVIELIQSKTSGKKVQKGKEEVTVRGANLFVIDVDQYVKI